MAKTVRQRNVESAKLLKRIKVSEIPKLRAVLLEQQKGYCALCGHTMQGTKQPALDHDHKTGFIRDVLCINCNGMEGKVFSLARRGGGSGCEALWLSKLIKYYEKHIIPLHGGIIHPTYKTEEEKRLARNAKARSKRKLSDAKSRRATGFI